MRSAGTEARAHCDWRKDEGTGKGNMQGIRIYPLILTHDFTLEILKEVLKILMPVI